MTTKKNKFYNRTKINAEIQNIKYTDNAYYNSRK